MDAYLDGNVSDVQSWYRNTFTAHYENNRQPFGLYQHPIHLAVGYPGVEDPLEERTMINEFLDWAQQQQNVWIVTNQQLIAWMRDPKPVSVSGGMHLRLLHTVTRAESRARDRG